jgi:hypothetical protein
MHGTWSIIGQPLPDAAAPTPETDVIAAIAARVS